MSVAKLISDVAKQSGAEFRSEATCIGGSFEFPIYKNTPVVVFTAEAFANFTKALESQLKRT